MKDRVAIVVGHSSVSRGARNYLDESEYSFNYRIGSEVNKILSCRHKKEACLFYRKEFESIGFIGEEIAEYDPDLSIELHFNAFEDPVLGTEVLINSSHKRYQSGMLAKYFMEEMAKEFEFKQRGIIKVSRGKRGHINLESIHKCNNNIASILVEPTFGNFETKESSIFFASESSYINVLVKTILLWYQFNENE